MAFQSPSKASESTQELRLATTMTGGVSLAIWMAGVTREINLLAQASEWRLRGGDLPASTLTTAAETSLKLYAELIDLLDVVADVDILSGTSAGGINAAFLAWSRVKGADLGNLRELWLDLGALTDLLRDPTDASTPSLLYGDERMFKSLDAEIPTFTHGPFQTQSSGDLPSTTLYITTTLLNGETSRFTDSFGTQVQDVDRRGVFTFTEQNLTNGNAASALALAARSSASFPAAFEPSFIPFTEGTVRSGDVPARPPMARFTNFTRPHWVADGGLLDNQPIDVVLQRIFDRPAQRPVRRVLLFVVPSSGPTPTVEEAPQDRLDEPLGLVDALLKDLTAMTSQSISVDLRAIRTHQDRMHARANTRLHLAQLAINLGSDRPLLTPRLLTDYAQQEATRHAQAVTAALLRQLSTWPAANGSPQSIPMSWEANLKIGGDAENLCRTTITESIKAHWLSPGGSLPTSTAELARYGRPAFDLAKACAIVIVRAAYQLATTPEEMAAISTIAAGISNACPPPEPFDLGDLITRVCTNTQTRNRSLDEAAKEIAKAYLEHLEIDETAWAQMGSAIADGRNTLDDIAKQSLTIRRAADAVRPPDSQHLNQLKTYLTYLGEESTSGTVATKLFNLAATQRAMLPTDADVEQSLELIQVSADTRCQLAPDFQTATEKLTGMQFHHFGAFYKRSWRANDWMWGRLDGAGWLVHALLDPRRVQWIVPTPEANGAVSRAQWFVDKLGAIGAPDIPSANSAPAAVLTELRFLDNPDQPMPTSLPHTSMWLAQSWQRSVLDEELDALADAVLDPRAGEPPDWSPETTLGWAESVRAASASTKYGLLPENPIAAETFATDGGSPLMSCTIAKAVATVTAAAGSVEQLPGVLKPPLNVTRMMTVGAYRAVWWAKGDAHRIIILGASLLTLGAILLIVSAATALQGSILVGLLGLLVAGGTGAYLIALGMWQHSSRPSLARVADPLTRNDDACPAPESVRRFHVSLATPRALRARSASRPLSR
ncbi:MULTISPECIES: patatin-like protein [unclassified Mycobacterium]|uniref:patatin-like protein n=1 Tax=unclassified Mycobacterium TaxID=2642494 RepID=UPI00048DCF77|nr:MULTISPECIES: patatin-like protein [unclassified Mycobacterium]SEA59597.1 patatin-related protein [Mycobacterium sp. 283mftsu]